MSSPKPRKGGDSNAPRFAAQKSWQKWKFSHHFQKLSDITSGPNQEKSHRSSGGEITDAAVACRVHIAVEADAEKVIAPAIVRQGADLPIPLIAEKSIHARVGAENCALPPQEALETISGFHARSFSS